MYPCPAPAPSPPHCASALCLQLKQKAKCLAAAGNVEKGGRRRSRNGSRETWKGSEREREKEGRRGRGEAKQLKQQRGGNKILTLPATQTRDSIRNESHFIIETSLPRPLPPQADSTSRHGGCIMNINKYGKWQKID